MSIPECIENQKGKKGVNYGQTPASLLPLQLESLKLGSEQLTPNKSAQLSRFTIKDWIDTAPFFLLYRHQTKVSTMKSLMIRRVLDPCKIHHK